VFVDLLPDTWSGQPPGLPPEVIRELSERARAAERALRQQRAAAEAQKRTPVRVRASVQPTFVRFVFETPDGVGVSSVLNDQKLTLLFNAALSFDLADAKVAAPSNIASINQKIEGESSAVEVALIGDVDVRSFREEKNYIIDVAFQQAEKASALLPPAPDASHAPAPVAPASSAPVSASPAATAPAPTAPGASEKPADAPPASRQSGEIAPPASESAQQAKIELKPVEVQTLEMSIPAPPSKEMPPAAAPPSTTLAAPEPPPQAKAADNAAPVSARRDSDGLRLMFSFATATPAALFRRADTVWLVFDSLKPLDIEPIRSQGASIISEVSLLPLEKGQAMRIRLSKCLRSRARIRPPVQAGWSHSPIRCKRQRSRWWRYATSPIPRLPMSPCPCRDPGFCIGWSIRTPATL
jgi:hypothetical protein